MSQYSNSLASRQLVVDALKELVAKGLTSGSSGNVSVSTGDGHMLITPTGVSPDKLLAEHIVHLDLDGNVPPDGLIPSSEWRMHADIYRNKQGLEAIVHCHSNYATMLACARKTIPPFHYMIAALGGQEIPLAEYATFGTQGLSDAVLEALNCSMACLLSNHGQLATGFDLEGAMKATEMVEEFAYWYWGILSMGNEPVLLDNEELEDVLTGFSSYGQQAKREDLASGNKLS